MSRHLVGKRSVVVLAAAALVSLAWLAQPAAAQSTAAKAKPSRSQPAKDDLFTGSSAATDNDPFGAPSARAKRPVQIRGASRDPAAEAKIRGELCKPTELEFIETPLQDAVDYLKDLHGIEIQIDEKALEESGVSTDVPMTRELKGITLGSALRLLLEPIDASYVVRDGVLLITTPDALSKMIELRVYNVRDLMQPDGDPEELAAAMRLALIEEPQVATFRELLVVRASIAQHEVIDELLTEMREKLDSKSGDAKQE